MEAEVFSKLAESGLGWLVAGYLFFLFIREKDKRIKEARLRTEDRILFKQMRKFFQILTEKAESNEKV